MLRVFAIAATFALALPTLALARPPHTGPRRAGPVHRGFVHPRGF